MLVLLKCPRCNRDLRGANNSKIFFCTGCDRGYDLDDGQLQGYPVFYIESKIKKENPQVFFPFWRILSEYRISPPDQNPLPAENKFFYIPAFFIKNISFFGDIGYYLTFKNIELKQTRKKDLAIFPADRGLKDCLVYPLIYLYQAETSNKKRRKLVDITIDHRDISLVMISFYKINGRYQDSIISWEYPSGALV